MAEYELIIFYLDKTCGILAFWLEQTLPKFSEKWRENNVVDKFRNG